ncbi:hypothetical protein ACU4GH_20165 [Bradyrhizobium betae]
MSAPLICLILLITATPAFAISNQALGRDISLTAAAIILLLVARETPEKLSFVLQRLKVFWLAAAVPLAWLAFQLLPLPEGSLTNSLWSAASTALAEHWTSGHVTIDIDATFRSMISYLGVLALTIAAAVIGRDRAHAKDLLTALSVGSTLTAILLLIARSNPNIGLPTPDSTGGNAMTAITAMAIIANGCILVMTTGQTDAGWSFDRLGFTAFAAFGIAISFVALKAAGCFALSAAALAGIAVQGFVVLVRRLKLRSWQAFSLFLVLAALATSVVAARNPSLIDFADRARPEDLADVQRALSEAPWPGSGAGTFGYVMQMYRSFGLPPMLIAPSTVIAVSAEWGRAALWLMTASVTLLCLALFWATLRRSRDTHFPLFAATVLLVTLCQAFLDPSLRSSVVQTTIAIAIGLGLSQKVGEGRRSGADRS